MLNETLFLSSFDELKDLLLHELTIFHVAIVYVLMYVVYKALGRYIYFKPEEHASKINRTFVTLSLLVVLLHSISDLSSYLPVLPEHRWLFMLCGLVIFIAPLSMLMDRVIWDYKYGGKSGRRWVDYYLPISRDYYETTVPKSERDGNTTHTWEDKGVKSTGKNIHSDALLNVLALIVFIAVGEKWAHDSAADYGSLSYAFSILICLTIGGIFFDRSVFSWIHYLEDKVRMLLKARK